MYNLIKTTISFLFFFLATHYSFQLMAQCSVEVSTLAGNSGISGSANGNGTNATFNSLYGIAVDAAGNVYVAETRNHLIRKITPNGTVTTLAGKAGQSGHADGTGTNATFDHPTDVTTDASGNVYVADQINHLIRKITPTGVVTTVAGKAGVSGHADGNGTNATFRNPFGIVVDGSGNIYVADEENHLIRKITAAGVVSTLAGKAGVKGTANGTTSATFHMPTGVATDANGNVYVAEQGGQTIRKITPAGVVSTFAGKGDVSGYTDGAGAEARFRSPDDVAVDAEGNVYVADYQNHVIRRISSSGQVTTIAGTPNVHGSANGTGANATFWAPLGVAVDAGGNVYVVDYGNALIRKIEQCKCLTGTYTFKKQSEIDNFGTQYAMCSAPNISIEITDDNDGNDNIVNLNGLSHLTAIGGDLTIYKSNSLDHIDALANLQSIGGVLEISYNAKLLHIDGLIGVKSLTDELIITNNNMLQNISGLSSLTTIGSDFDLFENPVLENVDGLKKLTSVSGAVDFFAMPKLTSCCGIYPLLNGNGVSGGYNIKDNPSGCNSKDEIIQAGPCN